MNNDNFSEKLYTSTEVAEILGVSLRSIYRYLDENKIQAAVKTATGRHRFTRQNINDFLHPGASATTATEREPIEPTKRPVESKKVNYETSSVDVVRNKKTEATVEDEKIEEEPVDWLSRFRQAAEKYKTQENVAEVSNVKTSVKEETVSSFHVNTAPIIEEKIEDESESEYKYYRSGVGGLKEIAQNIDKAAKNASLDYAFTMNAGLSLHKPIKPFSVIHAYVRPGDLAYFEKVLQLTPSQKDTAQLCLITSNDSKLYNQRKEMHGLYVVSDNQIKLDLLNEGETELANELE